LSGYCIAKPRASTEVSSPNGPHTDIQNEFVRRLFVEARSVPDLSIPLKYCNGTEARSHTFWPKGWISIRRGPSAV